jgi:hypothetical protein
VSEPDAEPGAWGWLAAALLGGCGALAGLVESMLIPVYAGSVLVPIAPVLAVLSNIVLPRLGRYGAGRTAGAVVPFAGWLVVVVALSMFNRPEGDVIYPGGTWLQWCSYGVIIGGTLAGAITIVVTLAVPRQRDVRR